MLLSVAHRSSAKALRHVRSYAATTHAVSSDGTRIAYTTTAGGGTPTLLINGWAGCAADWGSLVDRLGGSGRRIVAFDPRGFGASGDGAVASVRTLSEDVWKSKFYCAFVLNLASTSTPSMRRLLDGVAMPVLTARRSQHGSVIAEK